MTPTEHARQLPTHSEQTGALVAGFMAQAGVIQAQVALVLALPLSSVSRRLRGLTPFTGEQLARIAAFLNTEGLDVDVADLIPPAPEDHMLAGQR